MYLIFQSTDTTKSVFGFSDKVRFKPARSATETIQNSEISLVASLDMILSNKPITKVLIRLHRCAGWSAPLLSANPEDRFSHVEAHIKMSISHVKAQIKMSSSPYNRCQLLSNFKHCILIVKNHNYGWKIGCWFYMFLHYFAALLQ